MRQLSFSLPVSALLALLLAILTDGHAAQRQQGAGVEEGKCELVSVGNYFCKVNGKCYYCTKKDNPDPNKDCYKETTCAAATTRPGIKGSARPPSTTNPPVLRRGVEGEQPDAGMANPSGTSPETK